MNPIRSNLELGIVMPNNLENFDKLWRALGHALWGAYSGEGVGNVDRRLSPEFSYTLRATISPTGYENK